MSRKSNSNIISQVTATAVGVALLSGSFTDKFYISLLIGVAGAVFVWLTAQKKTSLQD